MLGTVTKQPADQLDYDLDFTRWLPDDDEILTVETYVTPDGDLTVDSYAIDSPYVKVWVSGGTDTQSYKVTVIAGTRGGRVKEVDFNIRIRDC